MNRKKFAAFLLVIAFFAACKKGPVDNPKPPSHHPPDPVVDLTTSMEIKRSEKLQTIDGFGFFGAQTVWWESDASKLYSETWAKQVINDLGITIWRNEYYASNTATVTQDADWNKQKPVVEGLAKVAKDSKVPLKFIFTVWSPPGDMKVEIDKDNKPILNKPHAFGTKKGGTLDPAKYNEFGNWLADGIQLYKNSGVDVYAISPQNEPLFKQDFNSCVYAPNKWYAEMLKNSMPVVKGRFPDVKIFGSENMLEIETEKDRQWFYGADLMKNPEALNKLDIWAVHGYMEGVTPTTSSKLPTLWETAKREYAQPSNKSLWMTETSGYSDNWKTTAGKPGAIDLAMDIFSALYYGNISAWVWWQGSGGDEDFSLMDGMQAGKKYYASKQFYRFIRPESKMVKLSFNAADNVVGAAFENTGMGSFTVVLINPSDKVVKVNLAGANVPNEFDFYYTTQNDNCKKLDQKVKKSDIILPASSVVTLVNGNVFE